MIAAVLSTVVLAGPHSVFTPPASVPSDCSRPADQALNTWMRTVPDGSTIRFAKGCYGVDGGLVLADRHGLVVDGQGSEFRALTLGDQHRVIWHVEGGSNVTLEHMTARGANPKAGLHASYYINGKSYEWQHAYSFSGTQTGTLDNVQGYSVYGDFVEAQGDFRPGHNGVPISRNVTVRRSRFQGATRQGIGLTGVDGAVIDANAISDVAQAGVDFEPVPPQPVARNVKITANTFQRVWFSVVSISGIAASNSTGVGHVTISGNQMAKPGAWAEQSCFPPVWINSSLGATISDFTVAGNVLWSIGPGIFFQGVNGAVVQGNTVHGPALCRRNAGVEVHASAGIRVGSNVFDGRVAVG